jgi:hypothetical protein
MTTQFRTETVSSHAQARAGTAQADDRRVLLIKAKGGLGNRILSAISGLVFADLTDRTPVIDWRDGSYAPLGENAYPLLFDTPIVTPCEAFDAVTGPVSPPVWDGHLGLTPQAMIERFDPERHQSATVYRRFCTDLSRLDAPEDIAVFWCYLPKFGRLRRHMRRDPRFAGRSVDAVITDYLTRYFTPNGRVRAEVAANLERMPRPIIGVHVRYTDRKVPLGRVKATLRRRLAERPGASIFLATDNAAVQAELGAEFPNVHHTQKYLNADGARLHQPGTDPAKTREAENALIDMWLLAHCDHLIYSRYSTFSVTSALVGGLTAAQQDDVHRFNATVVAKRILQNYV